MTDERNEDWAGTALSGFGLRPAGQELRERILGTARAEWDRRARERREFWRTARRTALAVAAALVAAFVVSAVDEKLTAAARPAGVWTALRKAPAESEPAWLKEIGVTAPLHRRMLAARRRRWGDELGARGALLKELITNGG